MIHAEAAARIAVTEHHHTFARRFIVIIAQGRKPRRRPQAVRGRNVKRGDLIRSLSGNCRAENAVVCHCIASRAIVLHGHGGVTGRRIEPVIKRQALYSIRIMHPRRDHRRLVRRRQARRMCHVINGRPRIGNILAVGSARCAEVGGNRHGAGGFEPVAVQTEQRLRPAAQPARLEPQRGGLAGLQVGAGQGNLTGIDSGPETVAATDVQGMSAAAITAVLQTRTHHAALE